MSGPVHIDDRRPPQSVFVRHVDRPQWSALPHAVTHGHAALAFYVGGSAELEQRGRLRVGAGDVHIVPAGEAHRMTQARGVDAWCLGFDVVGLGPELAGLLAPFERVRDGAAAVVAIPAGRQEHLRGLLTEMRREAATPGGARSTCAAC